MFIPRFLPVTLTVRENGAIARASRMIEVDNQPPSARFTATPDLGNLPLRFALMPPLRQIPTVTTSSTAGTSAMVIPPAAFGHAILSIPGVYYAIDRR